MVKKAVAWFNAHRKAFAAPASALIVYFAAHKGFDIDPQMAAIIAALIAGPVTSVTPNKGSSWN